MRKSLAAVSCRVVARDFLLFLNPPMVQAASKKVTVLKEGKTYTYDLNGGKKKEKIKYTFRENTDNKIGQFVLYINNKKVCAFKTYSYNAFVSLLDVNVKDKYKEMYICCTGDSDCIENLLVVRYKNNKNVKKYKLSDASWQGVCSRFGDYNNNTIISNTGKNKFYTYVDTPFYNGAFGCYHAKVAMKLKGSKLVCVNSDTYDLKKPNLQIKKYTLARSMNLYKTSAGKKIVTTLPSGTKFTATKIKPINPHDYNSFDVYVKIKTSSGKTGWLFFPDNYYGEYLKEKPAWG